jgi:hypothetical protein
LVKKAEGILGVNIMDILSSIKQTLGTKTHKKCCHVEILEGIVFCPAGQRTNFCSLPIKLLESFVLLTDYSSVKLPLDIGLIDLM